jgi:hypothetical protein
VFLLENIALVVVLVVFGYQCIGEIVFRDVSAIFCNDDDRGSHDGFYRDDDRGSMNNILSIFVG